MAPALSLSNLPIPLGIEPMEAKLVSELPGGEGWQYEPKWDGFRCLAFRAGNEVALHAKSGKPLTPYFPEMAQTLAALPRAPFVLDGELAIPIDGELSFDALQMRIHPAESRVKKLARETPSILILFDILLAPGANELDCPLSERRQALEAFFASLPATPALKLSPVTRSRQEAQTWLDHAAGAIDGVVAKRLDQPYLSGERAMLKVKRLRTADCVVGGFRYGSGSRQVGSLLLGLYNEAGKLDHVGFTSTIANRERAALTKRLEALAGGKGFDGNAPGGPSRWSTERSGEWVALKPKLVVEVRYDHVTGGRFRHGTKLVRFRPDKAPLQCTFEQLEPAMRPGAVGTSILT